MFAPDALDRVTHKLRDWGGDVVGLLPNLAVAIIVFAAFVLLSKLVKKLVYEALKRVSKHVQVNELLASTVRLAILIAGLFIALGILKLDKTVTSLLAGVGVVGLALGFAFKDIAANYMSGVIIAVRVPFEVGDLVKIKDFFGTVHALDLRTTGIRMPSGELVYIPNQDVLGSPIVNWTRAGERRVELKVGISYGSDLEQVRNLGLEAIRDLPERDQKRDAEALYVEFGDSSIELELRFWIRSVLQSDFLAARSSAIMAVKRAFDANGIVIPFPIRTLDFGALGGEALKTQLISAVKRRTREGGPKKAS